VTIQGEEKEKPRQTKEERRTTKKSRARVAYV